MHQTAAARLQVMGKTLDMRKKVVRHAILFLAAVAVLSGCQRVPLQERVQLHERGFRLESALSGLRPEEHYLGLGINPPFAGPYGWEADRWDEVKSSLEARISISILDANGVVVFLKEGWLTDQNDWILTNSSPREIWNGSLYTFPEFYPERGMEYKVILHVEEPAEGSQDYEPTFFISEMQKFAGP